MNKQITLLLTLIFAACDDVENLQYYCENRVACWLPPGAENTKQNIIFDSSIEEYEGRAAFCGSGYTVCENEDVKCVDITYAEEEKCDGVDNDCNGTVDDPEKFWAGIANTKCYFEEIGECRYSEQACVDGELVCLYNTSPYYGPEICDGKDNDCDGEYDEDYQGEFVYNGPLETANVGECRAGITRCIDGQEEIYGMVLPRTEICSNSKDDDCDGLEDESETGIASVDYAFFIDFSGSMEGARLDSVIESVCSFVGNPIFIDSRFAMIGISVGTYNGNYNNDIYGLHLISDFTDIATACSLLDDFVINVIPGADEYQVDAVINSFINGPYSIPLSWSDRERKVYIFSDEQPQALSNIQIRLDDFVDSCMENNFTVGIFTESYLLTSGWDILLNGCGGFIEDIDNLSNNTYFQNNYLIWFGGSC